MNAATTKQQGDLKSEIGNRKAEKLIAELRFSDGGFFLRLLKALDCADCPAWMRAMFFEDARELDDYFNSPEIAATECGKSQSRQGKPLCHAGPDNGKLRWNPAKPGSTASLKKVLGRLPESYLPRKSKTSRRASR